MITDKIIDVLLALPLLLIDSLPEVDFKIPDNVINGVSAFLLNLGYFLPFKELMPILVISLSVKIFQIAWALVIRIKSFIPTMGA